MGSLNPQEQTSAPGAWRMVLCARNGPEHLQQLRNSEIRNKVGGG